MLLVEDFRTSAWKHFEAHLQARLADLRELNDGMTHTNEKTAGIRGQISMVKELLALPKGNASLSGEPMDAWPHHDAE